MQAAHVARNVETPQTAVSTIRSDARTVEIGWGDGHVSTFHTIWLRDNCSCEICGDHSGGHRFFELGALPGSLANSAVLVGDMVQITWDADGHVTRFDPAWLRAHCYSETERAARRHQPETWDASITGNVPEVDYVEMQSDEHRMLALYDAVRTHGICLVRNVPATRAATEDLAALIGHVRETHYGRVFEIISTPNPKVIANAPVPLRPHTDENFREPPPGIMIFHSLKASECGGGASVMTDGFKLAEDFEALDPEAYDLLSRVPIPHRRFIADVGLRAEAPVITLDYHGNITQFRLNERTMGPIDLAPDLIEPVYAALGKLFELSYDARYHMHHVLQDGEALVFDNARVLHARTGFNGNRHVRLTHVGADEFYSRWRQLRSRLHGDINLI